MDTENKNEMGKENGNGIGDGSQTGVSTQFRVVINDAANKQLEAYVKQASEGNEPVNISKSDLANYIFCNLSRFLSDSDLKTLRSQHFDDRAVLKGLLKKAKDDADLPPELKRALRDYYGVSEREKKRSSKTGITSLSD